LEDIDRFVRECDTVYYRLVEDAVGWAELESLWPIKKFPRLRDGEATIVESGIIVEYLMRRYPGGQLWH
jgi:glutathione S-transferase